ncbi:pentatricopeptide repeat-containing protein At4g21065-like [Telopea speciosissima]|uniref:pentatricopeptide repeat-containing protein At4g21065-like n=1 Tax=Telopea speciosissima TaxID=54955 RepID=UPI001CC49D25|nr:pentatricopeptide repeat-containing protein At4g21065-like [Telopea speciosissima]
MDRTLVLDPIGKPPQFLRRSKAEQYFSLLLRQNPRLKLHELKQVHAQLIRRDLHHDNILITKLISLCSDSGTMDYAGCLFNYVEEPDLILCNSILRGYTRNGHFELAILFYIRFILREFIPDNFTFPYVLKACAAMCSTHLGQQIHGYLIKNSTVSQDIFVLNSLLDMYFKCHQNEAAMLVFKQIAEPNLTSWNIMLLRFVSSGDLNSAQKMFDEMPQRDAISWNTMISAYAKSGQLEIAKNLFDEMPERNLVSWNALIAGYSKNNKNVEALSIFSQMLKCGIRPDNATILSVISAVFEAASPDSDAVEQIIAFAKSANSLSVSTGLLSLYAKLGRMDDARKVFDEIPEKDLVTWNAMIAGYSQNQRPMEAIKLFREMQSERRIGVKPDQVTMVSVIASCSQIGTLELGEWVHAYIKKNEIMLDVFLATSLIDMYAKCGDVNRSRHLFQEMPTRDLAAWNAMIKGLAIHGQGKEALEIFSLMKRDGVLPNDITFVGLLSACSHGGLAAEGLEVFNLMQNQCNIVPQVEHYGCVVDLLGRAGQLTDAYEFIKRMPVQPDRVVWGALLCACQSHQNVELAEEAANRLIELDPSHDGNYVLLSNVYASVRKWRDVAKVRAWMKANHVQKTPGCSAVELGGALHEFSAGDRSHPRSVEIYAAWDELVKRIKSMGYEPDTGVLLRNLNEEDGEQALYCHSEKLALTFALITSEPESPIKIVKNLRICGDCHRAIELVSKLENREITVRDRNRFHHFKAGFCSCGGYW